jgi:zinc transporter ZupT
MEVNYIEILINMTLASIGGLVKRAVDGEKYGRKITFSYYAIGSFISTFVGIIVYFMLKSFNISQFLIAGLTALAGYMGAPVLELLSEAVKKRIEKETNVKIS